MKKSILSKCYKCTAQNDVGTLWAEVTSIRVENKLSIINGNRTSYARAHLHSTIQRPAKLNQLLLEIELYKTENPEIFCHKDEKIDCVGVFKHWPKKNNNDEFCYLSVDYKQKEFIELIQLLNQAYLNDKMKLYISIDVVGLDDSCEYKPDGDLQHVLLVKSTEFGISSAIASNVI